MTARSADGPFLWNVAGLLTDLPGSDRTYPIDGVTIGLPDELALAEPVSGQVRLTRTNRGIVADARLRTTLAGECARCLRPATTPVDLRIDEEYLPSLDLATGAPVSTDDEPDALRLTDHHELDLEPSVRDAIVLAEPIAPLDRPDCPGLCIVCGLPLDEGAHDHPDEDLDPRFAALRELRTAGDEERTTS
jgi:uncharacterized protein